MKENKLHNIKSTGFKVPENYFETLNNRIIDHSKLKVKVDGSGLKVPNGYFDTLEDKIVSHISKKETPKVISIFRRKSIIYASSIAAAIALLFNLSNVNNTPTIESLDNETLENYLINEGVELYEIGALLTVEDLTENDFKDVKINKETFEDYILSDIDIEAIIIE